MPENVTHETGEPTLDYRAISHELGGVRVSLLLVVTALNKLTEEADRSELGDELYGAAEILETMADGRLLNVIGHIEEIVHGELAAAEEEEPAPGPS